MYLMRILFFLTLLIGFNHSWATVPKEERALLAIVDLAEEAAKHKWLYRLEVDAAVRRIKRISGDDYGSIVIHARKEATYQNFLKSLEALLRDEKIQRIDLIIYVHGKNPDSPTGASVCFVGTPCTPMGQVSDDVQKRVGDNSHKLRMVYSDACWGKYHMQEWLDAGFKAVTGARGVDANHSADLRKFLRAWGEGRSFEESIQIANKFWLTPVVDEVIRDADSFKLMKGEIGLTIED